jgi:hypothetical protein
MSPKLWQVDLTMSKGILAGRLPNVSRKPPAFTTIFRHISEWIFYVSEDLLRECQISMK